MEFITKIRFHSQNGQPFLVQKFDFQCQLVETNIYGSLHRIFVESRIWVLRSLTLWNSLHKSLNRPSTVDHPYVGKTDERCFSCHSRSLQVNCRYFSDFDNVRRSACGHLLSCVIISEWKTVRIGF